MISARSRRVPTSPQKATIVALLLASCFITPEGVADAMPATLSVDISRFAFVPKEVTIAPGTKIVWTNHDETPHTVTSEDKAFSSKGLVTDDKYEYTFSREGDFAYHCTVHPYMTGVVHVRKQ
jgi:plastocyanin